MKKILIIRLSSIGDIVLTTPVIRCLKHQIKDVSIQYLIKPQYYDVIKNNPYIDKIHKYDKKNLVEDLKKENFDFIIDLHKNLRSLKLRFALKVKSYSFNKLNIRKWLYVNFKINKMPDIHIVERYLKTVQELNVENDNKGLDYFLSEEEDIKKLPEKHKQGYILIALGAQHNTKKLSKEKIISICKLLKQPVILAGGKGDFETAEYIKNNTGELVYNACGKYSINQSAFLVKEAEVVITHDTGLMHIASAFQKKIISVWGNTVPEFGMYPYKAHKNSKIFQVEDLKCRPCSKIGYQKCPKKHFRCMNDIDENLIAEYVNEILKR